MIGLHFANAVGTELGKLTDTSWLVLTGAGSVHVVLTSMTPLGLGATSRGIVSMQSGLGLTVMDVVMRFVAI
jgi:hypothetical protein